MKEVNGLFVTLLDSSKQRNSIIPFLQHLPLSRWVWVLRGYLAV